MTEQVLDSDLYQNNLTYVRASKGKRFLNFSIDYIIAILLAGVVFIVIDILGLYFATDGIIGRLFGMFLLALYYIVAESALKGKTIGKYITKTRAIHINGSTMEMSTVVKRSFSRIVPFEAFSFLGNEATGWHDTWSDTMVIDETQSPDRII